MNKEEKEAFLAEIAEHNDKGKVRELSAKEKEILIEERKYKKDNCDRYNKILEATMEIIKATPYCWEIFKGANYQEIPEAPRKPDEFDESGIYLQDVYIGNHTGPSGHVTKEAYLHAEEGFSPQNGTHDVIFISSITMKQICETVDKLEVEDKEKEAIASYMLLNLVTHEASHGNQINRCLWEAQRSRAEQGKYDLDTYCIDLYARANLSDKRAKNNTTLYDENTLKTKNEKMRKNVLKYFGKNSYGELDNSVKERIENLEVQYKPIYDKGGSISQGRVLTKEQVIIGYLKEALNEAGVMADSYMALLSLGNEKKHKIAREKICEFWYKERTSDMGILSLIKLDDDKYRKMFGAVTKEEEKAQIKARQNYAKNIFKDITQTMFAQYMSDKLELKPEYLPKIEDALNRTDVLFALASVYEPRCFGSVDEFVNEALPKNSLSDDNKKKLALLINHPELRKILETYKKDKSITDQTRDMALSYFIENGDKVGNFMSYIENCKKEKQCVTCKGKTPDNRKTSTSMSFMGDRDR